MTGEGRRLAMGASWLFAARVLAQAALVIFTIVVARRLGPVAFGEYAFVAAVLVVANVLTSFGTDMLLVREIAARRAAHVSAAFVLQLALSAGALLVGLVAPPLPAQSASATAALRVALSALLPLALYTVLSAMLRGSRRMGSFAVVTTASPVAQLVAAIVLVPSAGGTAVDVAVVVVLTQIAAAIVATALCIGSGVDLAQLWSDPRPQLARVARDASPIALLGLLGMLYQRAGILIVSTALGAAATGAFGVSSRAVEAAKTGHIAALGALYPALAERAGARAETEHRASLALLMALAAIAALALALAADPLVALLFGSAFAAASDPLRILALTLVPYAFASYRSTALVAARREGAVARALAVALAVLAGVSAWSIPALGLNGIAWAALAAEVAQAVVFALSSMTAVSLARAARASR